MTLKAQASQYQIEDVASRRRSANLALDHGRTQENLGFLCSFGSVALPSLPLPPSAEHQVLTDPTLSSTRSSCTAASQRGASSVDIMIFCDAENRDGRTDGASQKVQSSTSANMYLSIASPTNTWRLCQYFHNNTAE
jgi:hypothetical protein